MCKSNNMYLLMIKLESYTYLSICYLLASLVCITSINPLISNLKR